MLPSEKTVLKNVYPVEKTIRLEIKPPAFGSAVYSERVKIGKFNWRIGMKRVLVEGSQTDDCVNVLLQLAGKIKYTLPVSAVHQFRIKNLKDKNDDITSELITGKFITDTVHEHKSFLISYEKLEKEEFAKDGKIIVECLVRVVSDDGCWENHDIDIDEKRPNTADVEAMFERKIDHRVERITTYFDMSRISEEWLSSDHCITVFGVPMLLSVSRKGADFYVRVRLNPYDKSPFWRCYAAVSVVVFNVNKRMMSLLSSECACYSNDKCFFKTFENSYFKIRGFSNGQKEMRIDVYVQLVESYGLRRNGMEVVPEVMYDVKLCRSCYQFIWSSKKTLAHFSPYLKTIFSKEPEKSEFKIPNEPEFLEFLKLIHDLEAGITEENAEKVLKIIKTYGDNECFDRIDNILVDLEFKKEEALKKLAETYPLWKLKRRFSIKFTQESSKETEFLEPSDTSNVELEVGGFSFFANKLILANSSGFFMRQFYGPEAVESEKLIVSQVSPMNFLKLITQIYHPYQPMEDIDLFLKLGHQFSVPRLLERCEQFLILNFEDDFEKKYNYAVKYNFENFLSFCKNKKLVPEPRIPESASYESQIYPIHGFIKFKIEKMESFSEKVKVGKCEWRLFAKNKNNSLLSVYLSCLSPNQISRSIRIHVVSRLINPQKPKRYEAQEMKIDYQKDMLSVMDIKLIRNQDVIVECEFWILSESQVKRRSWDFQKTKPDSDDNKAMCGVKKYPNPEMFREVVKIAEQEIFTLIHGIPGKLVITKDNNQLMIGLILNSEDESLWWGCRSDIEIRIKGKSDFVKVTPAEFSYQSHPLSVVSIDINELIRLENGFVKSEKITVEVTIRNFEKWGFDEKSRKGFEGGPVELMTDMELIVNDKKFQVARKILIQQEFNALSVDNKLIISDVKKTEDFIRLLELIYNFDTDISEENVENVLELIKRFNVLECYERCDMILKKLVISDKEKMKRLVGRFPLPGLKSKVLPDDSFEVEPYQFITDFEKSCENTDVEIEVNGRSYYASKQILANSSFYFMKKFYGPHSNKEPKIQIFDISTLSFEKLLTHIYHPTRPVTSANIDSLLQLAHQFSVPRLMDKCEEYLVINDNISLIDKLEYAGNFEFPFLMVACGKLLDDSEKLKEVKAHKKFGDLSREVYQEIIRRC